MFSVNYPARENKDAKEDAFSGRKAFKIIDEQRYLMPFTWVLPEEAFIFRLLPEVVTVDVVTSMNNEKRPLFTMCGKTTHGKMFSFMRVFLLYEKIGYFAGFFV